MVRIDIEFASVFVVPVTTGFVGDARRASLIVGLVVVEQMFQLSKVA